MPSRWKDADLDAVRDLAADDASLPWSEWSMRPTAIRKIVDEIAGGHKRRLVELGAGVSTVLLARAAREIGGRVVSIEHDPEWAATVEDLLRRESLDRVARIVEAPLIALPRDLALPGVEQVERPDTWYELELVREACGRRIDLLVVDGPPAGDLPSTLVRAPALVLRDLLASSSTVFLDDISRPAERRSAELWQGALGVELVVDEEADIAVLHSRDA
jgi:methyltransferase family protein